VALFITSFLERPLAAPTMSLNDFSTLTFDVIGTLIDFEAGILQWMRPRLQAAKADITDDEILQVKPDPTCSCVGRALHDLLLLHSSLWQRGKAPTERSHTHAAL
jgi:phosphoglycolate phosphatase-like HAD superfamily hydrolase